MAREFFEAHRFNAEKQALIAHMNTILADYARQGYRLTLRQLYYQLVSKALIPNTIQSYKSIGDLLSNARLAGLVDWAMIEDRNRSTVRGSRWESPAEILKAVATQYQIDKWKAQKFHIEVMVEKDALSGVLEPVAAELDIAFTANKGYSSQSMMYNVGKRLRHKFTEEHKLITVLYLGDHDSSGIDMTRDVEERIAMFSGLPKGTVEVLRLALNMPQVEAWSPPPNPAKESDPRFKDYQMLYGDESWELDAVEPRRLAALVREAVKERRDEEAWADALKQQKTERASFLAMAEDWEEGRYTSDDEEEEEEQELHDSRYEEEDEQDDDEWEDAADE